MIDFDTSKHNDITEKKTKKTRRNIFNKNYRKGAFYYEAILQINEKMETCL